MLILNFLGSYSFFFFMTGNFLVLNYNKLSFLYDYQNRLNDLRIVDKVIFIYLEWQIKILKIRYKYNPICLFYLIFFRKREK